MKSTSINDKHILIESEPPQEEYKTKKVYDLQAITRDKSLVLYNAKERQALSLSLNKTLLNLVRMHCANEDIPFNFFLETVLVDFMKRNKIILCRVLQKKREIDEETRKAKRKREKQFKITLREMRGLRTVIKKFTPKKEKKILKIDKIEMRGQNRRDTFTGEGNE